MSQQQYVIIDLHNGYKCEGILSNIDKVNMKINLTNAKKYFTEESGKILQENFDTLTINKSDIKEVKLVQFEPKEEKKNVNAIPEEKLANQEFLGGKIKGYNKEESFFDNLAPMTNNEAKNESIKYNDKNKETFNLQGEESTTSRGGRKNYNNNNSGRGGYRGGTGGNKRNYHNDNNHYHNPYNNKSYNNSNMGGNANRGNYGYRGGYRGSRGGNRGGNRGGFGHNDNYYNNYNNYNPHFSQRSNNYNQGSQYQDFNDELALDNSPREKTGFQQSGKEKSIYDQF